MKKIIFVVVLLSALLIADSPKYDFTITIEIKDKSISEIADIVKDLEDVAKEYNAEFNIQIDNDKYSTPNIWGNYYLHQDNQSSTPFPYVGK
jgi:hypothetical protein